MVMLANQPPHLVCIACSSRTLNGCFRIAIPVPAPRGTGRIEHLKSAVAVSRQPSAKTLQPLSFRDVARNLDLLDTSIYRLLNWNRLRAPFCPYFLRSLPRESRVTMPSALSFLRNSDVELHQRAGDAQLHRVGLAVDSAARDTGENIERGCRSRSKAAAASRCERCASVTKYCSKGRPLTLKSPLPGRR